MKKSLVLLALLSLYGTAYATGASDNCNGSGSCSGGGTTTNQGGTAYGGQGGAGGASSAVANANGGAGGNAVANGGSSTAIGIGGSSSVDVRSSNSNSNSNKVESTNINGQQQGQSQSIKNSGNSKSSVESSGNNVGNADVDINVEAAKTYRPPVSTAYAPTIYPTAPCMGSTSGGVSGALISISGGSSWTSEECMILETARSFDQAGYKEDGLSVRCQGKWAKNAPSCKALSENKAALAPSKVQYTQVESKDKTPLVYSETGYYSVVTNPLGQ